MDKITTFTPGRCMGLQLADAAAGAVFNGLERDRYGNTEPRYIHELLPIVYRHGEKTSGYGMKIIPREAIGYIEKEKSLDWLKNVQ